MPVLRLTFLAVALTFVSAATAAIPGANRYVSVTAQAGDFGSCARGPCIRQADTQKIKTTIHHPHN
jgi:hypothetical protein